MEKKLQEYRAKQERAEKIQRIQEKLKNVFSFFKSNREVVIKEDEVTEKCSNKPKDVKSASNSIKELKLRKRKIMNIPEEEENLIAEDRLTIDEESLSENDSIWCCTWLQLFYYCLCFTLWVIVYTIFIKLQFGTVYLIVSALVFMYLNTGTTPKKSGEMSAYSVFNKDCASIDGTLKAEQFEREIMFGPGSVR